LQKFIIISILFHISLLTIVQLDLIEIKSEKKQVINIGVLEENSPPIKKKEPKKIVKKEPKKVIERFDNLLKNLASENIDDEIKKTNIDSKIKELSDNKLLEKTTEIKKVELSLIEKIILEQIDNNWTRPPGIKVAKNLVIKLIITLDTDGNVIKLASHKKTQADIINDSTLQPYLDSAVRAIKKSSPFEGLRKDKYSIWKEIIINFKPIEAR
jgi:hypothetical protein